MIKKYSFVRGIDMNKSKYLAQKVFRLIELRKNKVRIIKKIGNGMLAHKLINLGIIPGEKIKVVAESPFGDPMIILTRGCLVGVSKNMAENIKLCLLN